MKEKKELFEFLCELIDVQIKKYVSLATLGVGPDARLNAKLVFNEVNELLEFAGQLLELINHPKQGSADQQDFLILFDQTKFYVEQEYVRAYAGWLLSENNIHSGVKDRVAEQLALLNKIGEAAQVDCSIPSRPKSKVQKQCEYDSAAIALHILDLAKSIKENPDMELSPTIPIHARIILKKNATTRYCDEEFATPILALHKKYEAFLKESDLQKSSSVLLKEEALSQQKIHRTQWEHLLERYQKIEPSSALFSSNHEWYTVALPVPKKKLDLNYSSKNLMLFGGSVITGALVLYMLLSYFTNLDKENNLNPIFKF